jgi:hypothetical protein
VLLSMLAFAVDLGRIAVCRGELQGAADSAALAGASALGTDNLLLAPQYADQSTDTTNAESLAQNFAQANQFDLNAKTAVVLNKSTDVDVGILANPTNLSSPFQTSGSGVFNSVRVRTNVDANHGGNLNFFFAPVMHQGSTSLQATATATVQLYTIRSVKALVGARSPILPITMSNSDWQAMVNNQTGIDNYTFNSQTGQITTGSDGLQEQQLYPGSNSTSSNNGLIQFGTGSRSNRVLQDEVLNGPTYAQMIAQWPPNGVPPWNAQHEFTIGSDPGWRANTFDTLASVAASGEPRLIPINDGTSPGNGTGSYTIVAFAPVRVVMSNKGGSSGGYAMVQPAVINDPTVVPSNTLAPPGEGGVPVARLTR